MRWLLFGMFLGFFGCAPRYSGLEPIAPTEVWAPLPYQDATVDGIRLAYVDSGGDKPVLFFVHGLSSYLSFWEYQLEAFTDDYRVIAVDLPGYGASAKPDAPYTPPWYAELLTHFLDEVGVEQATWVGHSMGGQISLTAALQHPDYVERLVLAAPAGFEGFKRGHGMWMKSYWTESRALEASEEHVRINFTQMVFNREDDGVERLIKERVRMGAHPDFEGTSVAVARSIAGMIDFPVRDRLGEIAQPALVVFGTNDKMIPNPVFNGGTTRRVAERGTDRLKDGRLVLLPGAGHTVHHDDAERFNRAMRAFLEER